MKKMCYKMIAALAMMSMGTMLMGCQSCHRATSAPKNANGVPVDIADARLLSYKYTLQGTMRWPLHSESVEICRDDTTKCVIRLFDESRIDSYEFDAEGDPLPDSLIVSSQVLDDIKQMIIDTEAWRFKEDYSPRGQVMDGYSWGFSATFAVTDSVLAASPAPQRARGVRLTSGGGNAGPDTQLFEQVRRHLEGLFEEVLPPKAEV